MAERCRVGAAIQDFRVEINMLLHSKSMIESISKQIER